MAERGSSTSGRGHGPASQTTPTLRMARKPRRAFLRGQGHKRQELRAVSGVCTARRSGTFEAEPEQAPTNKSIKRSFSCFAEVGRLILAHFQRGDMVVL